MQNKFKSEGNLKAQRHTHYVRWNIQGGQVSKRSGETNQGNYRNVRIQFPSVYFLLRVRNEKTFKYKTFKSVTSYMKLHENAKCCSAICLDQNSSI